MYKSEGNSLSSMYALGHCFWRPLTKKDLVSVYPSITFAQIPLLSNVCHVVILHLYIQPFHLGRASRGQRVCLTFSHTAELGSMADPGLMFSNC